MLYKPGPSSDQLLSASVELAIDRLIELMPTRGFGAILQPLAVIGSRHSFTKNAGYLAFLLLVRIPGQGIRVVAYIS